VPAGKDILELFLMEEFHWTPMEIAKIPYKTIQKIFLIRSQKNSIQYEKSMTDKFKREQQSIGSGRIKRWTREV
jgi:hypothetical protein